MKPRIIILTGKKIHHKYFINELSKVGEIVGIIIEEKGKNFKIKKSRNLDFSGLYPKYCQGFI